MKDILTYCVVCRYNAYWEKYKKRVPYKILPHIYWHLLDQIDGSLFYRSLQMGSRKWIMINWRKLKRGQSNFLDVFQQITLKFTVTLSAYVVLWKLMTFMKNIKPSGTFPFLLISWSWGIVIYLLYNSAAADFLSFKPKGFFGYEAESGFRLQDSIQVRDKFQWSKLRFFCTHK